MKDYEYTYDALNRITGAIDDTGKYNLGGYDSSGNLINPITYDKNGNITELERKGHIVENPVSTNSSHFDVMDDLTYSYDSGNKLLKVSDAIVTPTLVKGEFKDDYNSTSPDPSNDYTYDSNGNLLTDTNKGITSITYNHLNLPKQVTFSGGNIQYKYDATGIKQKKIVSTGNTTLYAGNYIYENNTLQFFNHTEGYVNNDNGTFKYVYQYLDHLGSIRLSYSDGDGNGSISQSEIIEENHYYPYGLKMRGFNEGISSLGNSLAQKFKFQGQEFEESLDLNNYEFGLRQYDPALGRWFNTDPYEQFNSPYVAMGNNPVISIDPDGGYCYDANGTQIACPENELFDDARENDSVHEYIQDEVTVVTNQDGEKVNEENLESTLVGHSLNGPGDSETDTALDNGRSTHDIGYFDARGNSFMALILEWVAYLRRNEEALEEHNEKYNSPVKEEEITYEKIQYKILTGYYFYSGYYTTNVYEEYEVKDTVVPSKEATKVKQKLDSSKTAQREAIYKLRDQIQKEKYGN